MTYNMSLPFQFQSFVYFIIWAVQNLTSFTKVAVALATSLADCTNCFLATGLEVLELATRQELHSALVCLAITVAEVKICC